MVLKSTGSGRLFQMREAAVGNAP